LPIANPVGRARGRPPRLVFFQGELMGPSWMRGIFLSGLQVLSQKTSISATIENQNESGLDFALRFTW
jgi:hypothetical protein